MKNLKLLSLLALAGGFVMMTGCSKSSTSSTPVASKDSVFYSAWTPVVLTADPGDSTFEQNISATQLTQSVLDQGAILTYVEFQGVVNLPSDFSIFPSFSLNNINLFAQFPVASTDGLTFRYVIIPGNKLTTSVSGTPQTFTSNQLKGMNYAEVSKILNLPAQGSSSSSKYVLPQ